MQEAIGTFHRQQTQRCLFVGVAFFWLLYMVLFLFMCVFCFEGSDLNYYFYFFDLGDLRILFYPKMLL